MHSEDFTNLVRYQDEFRPGAQRYAVGENSNFILVPMMLEGLKQLLQWDPPRFQEYCKGLVDDLKDEIVSKGYWIEDESYRANHLFGIKIPEHISAALVKEALQRENISVSFRGSFIRVSPSVYNSVSEMKKFAYCLSKMT
jgi:selenocysteine lyase/cysteine desulfurase